MHNGVYERLPNGEWIVRIDGVLPVDGKIIEVTARKDSDNTQGPVKVWVYESDGETSRAELVRPGGRYARIRGRWLIVVNAVLPVGHVTGVVVVKQSGECHIRQVRIVGPAFSKKDTAGGLRPRSLGEAIDRGGVTKPRRHLSHREAQPSIEFDDDPYTDDRYTDDRYTDDSTEVETDGAELPSVDEYFDYFPDQWQEYDVYNSPYMD